MDNPTLLIIAVVLAAAFLVMWILNARNCSRLVSENLELKKQNDKLAKNKDSKRLKFSGSTASSSDKESDNGKETSDSGNSEKKGTKSKKNEDSPVVCELKEKVRDLKTEITKLKEKNYNLSKDNEQLRSDVRSNVSSSAQEQREIIELRESRDSMSVELTEAKAKVSELEKMLEASKREPAEKESIAEVPVLNADSERVKQLECENVSLSASLKDVRGELAGFKRDFKAQLDAAKAEVADSNRMLKKELSNAQRLMAQSKKRADNNHQIYLIARAQMLLAEKRLKMHDPSYKPVMVLPAGNEAIEEVIKKFVSMDARESRASIDVLHKDKAIGELNERIRTLENENATLKSEKGKENTLHLNENDSLSDLVSQFSELNQEFSFETSSSGGKEKGGLGGIDLSSLDDDWESV